MALNSSDRKTLSKKYVDIPDENIAYAQNITNLDALIVDLQSKDSSYSNLFSEPNSLIDLYHPEIDLLAGQVRTSLVEQDAIDAATKVLGNFLFPNNNQTPTPNLPDGIWKELKTYAKNKVVGKAYNEVYATQPSEADLMSDISTLTLKIFNDYSQNERRTGNPDVAPIPPLTFDLADDLAALEAAVNVWEASLNSQKSALLANTDTTQTSQINTAISNINASLAEISTWEALADYAVGGKVDDPGLAILDDEIVVRSAYIPIRIGEINTRLGDVVQAVDGQVSSLTGLYGDRYVPLDLRLNLAEGSLTKQKGLELAKRVQTENISNNNNTLQYLTNSVLVSSKLSEDGNGTTVIEVLDGSIFSVSDNVYVVSETQAEILATITNITINTITLNTNISSALNTGDVARLLKEV